MEFYGYRRKEGRPGIRNHILILPTCACGSESCRVVASQVRGAVNIVFNTGCSDVAANTAMSQKVLTGFALNPNVYGVVIIGLGCETVPHAQLRETTGRGTPTGNAIVPVLKVTANEHTYSWMEDNMDVDLSGIIRGEQTIEESGGMLLEKLHEIANGKLTKAEAYGFSDIAVDHVCRFV